MQHRVFAGALAACTVLAVTTAIAQNPPPPAAAPAPAGNVWREQLTFCLPAGLAVVLSMLNRNLGNLAVAKILGAASLAQYTIGTFGEPVVVAIRNSLSTVLLPEMVRRSAAGGDKLEVWKRTTVINCILLFPVAIIGLFSKDFDK